MQRYLLAFSIILLNFFSIVANNDVNVAILGDSNVWIGGDDCLNPKGWTKTFVDCFSPKSCVSYARSGATWTNTGSTQIDGESYSEVLDDNNVLFNQVMRLIRDVKSDAISSPDVVLLFAGANDAWFADKRPGIFSEKVDDVFADKSRLTVGTSPSEATSLAASVRLACDTLIEVFPNAELVIVTPPQITKGSNDDFKRVCEVLTACAAEMAIPVIRLDIAGPVYQAQEMQFKTNTTDGVHTSVNGAQKTGRFIANQLKSVLYF